MSGRSVSLIWISFQAAWVPGNRGATHVSW
jgi:hypothetical protein